MQYRPTCKESHHSIPLRIEFHTLELHILTTATLYNSALKETENNSGPLPALLGRISRDEQPLHAAGLAREEEDLGDPGSGLQSSVQPAQPLDTEGEANHTHAHQLQHLRHRLVEKQATGWEGEGVSFWKQGDDWLRLKNMILHCVAVWVEEEEERLELTDRLDLPSYQSHKDFQPCLTKLAKLAKILQLS